MRVGLSRLRRKVLLRLLWLRLLVGLLRLGLRLPVRLLRLRQLRGLRPGLLLVLGLVRLLGVCLRVLCLRVLWLWVLWVCGIVGGFGGGWDAGLVVVPGRGRVDRSGPVLFLGAVAETVLAAHCRHRRPFRSTVGSTVVRPPPSMEWI